MTLDYCGRANDFIMRILFMSYIQLINVMRRKEDFDPAGGKENNLINAWSPMNFWSHFMMSDFGTGVLLAGSGG